jgi:hypothetical protein
LDKAVVEAGPIPIDYARMPWGITPEKPADRKALSAATPLDFMGRNNIAAKNSVVGGNRVVQESAR